MLKPIAEHMSLDCRICIPSLSQHCVCMQGLGRIGVERRGTTPWSRSCVVKGTASETEQTSWSYSLLRYHLSMLATQVEGIADGQQ